ncbi:putative ribonuclease H-like domain-containing protein [Tanacetum coccineum]
MVPRTVLTRSGPILVNTVRPVNTVQSRTTVNNARLMKNVINNAYSTARRPFNKIIAANNSNFTKNVNTVKGTRVNTARPKAVISAVKGNKENAVKASTCWGNPQQDLKNKGVINSGCSRHMTGNRSYLTDYEEINGEFVAFGGNSKGGKSTRKGKIKTSKLDFEDVYFVKELKFNLFSVSQMCDKKNSVLCTDTKFVVLSPDFKLTDKSHVLLKVPRKDNMHSVYLKNVVPQGGLTCLFAKSTTDESNLWHMRLRHVNFKTMNKLVKRNLVRGLPSKLFEINQTCVACQKGKQHRASYKTKTVSLISQPLQMLHMDLFGPTFVKSLMKKMILVGIENLINLRVKVIRCDNGTEFKNRVMNQFCEMKGRKPALRFMRPFGCPVRILNTIDQLGTGPNWLFDIDALINSMNYKPVVIGNQSNGNACTKACNNADSNHQGRRKKKDAEDLENESGNLTEEKDSEVPSTEEPRINQEKDDYINNTNNINTASDGNNTNNVNAVSSTVNAAGT